MRLLLAEDEVELSNALVEILKRSNYSIDAVYNGQDAYDYIMTDVYDGIILDIMMPIKDGLSVLKDIRRAGNNTPVLLLTAKSEVDDRVEGLDAGADDYLTKPFAMKELLARVRSITRRASDAVSTEIVVGNSSLDTPSSAISQEAAFDTRYFTVTLDDAGDVTDSNIESIASIGQDEAKDIAKQLYTKNKSYGTYETYRYRLVDLDNGSMYIFVDCFREIYSCRGVCI